jgi:anti-sigma B factor antagonist
MPDQIAARKLTLEINHAANVVIVRCRGRLVAGENDQLHSRIRPLIPDNKRIVLDLTELSLMDSTGLGTLVRLYVTAKSAGCKLELTNVGKHVRELLGVTNVLSVFTIIGEHDIRMP